MFCFFNEEEVCHISQMNGTQSSESDSEGVRMEMIHGAAVLCCLMGVVSTHILYLPVHMCDFPFIPLRSSFFSTVSVMFMSVLQRDRRVLVFYCS